MSAAVAWGDTRIPANFWLRTMPEPNGGCWLRNASSQSVAKARRLAHEALIGPVPIGYYLEPTCGGGCVNPTHAYHRKPLPLALRAKHKRDRVPRERRLGFYIKSRYGITFEEYERLLAAQQNRCAICSMHFEAFGAETKYRPHIDHCHKTGKVRGLLCVGCNTGIGALRDSPELLAAAVRYLSGTWCP